MLRKNLRNKVNEQCEKGVWSAQKVSLAAMLTVPFILQVVTVVGLVGYLSYRNGQRSVEDLTNQLMDTVSSRIEQKLISYLDAPRLVNQMTSDAVRRGELRLDLNHSEVQREQYLWQQMQLFPTLAWMSLGSEDGDSAGVWRPGERKELQISLSNASTQYYGNYYLMNEEGIRTQRVKVEKPAFDPRTRPWYTSARDAKHAVWTPIYTGFTPGTIFIAASQPLYEKSGKLVGVIGTDLALSGIQQFLAQNSVSSSGQTFLIERSGQLVASSSQEPPFRLVQGQPPQRVHVRDSQTPLIRTTAQSLLGKVKDFTTIQQPQRYYFTPNGQAQFVTVLPFSRKGGLDWLIVIVVPEVDVMAQIHAGTLTTILLCLAAVMAVIFLNTWIGRGLVKPIIGLSKASQKIAQGDFSTQVRAPRIVELSTLATSFTQMSQEIQESRRQLEDYSRSLEQKVSDRTQALQQEVQFRTEAEVALQSANEELQRLAYLDGLTQIANRRKFDEQLSQEWRRLKRDRLPLSLILCDVDYFKQYNDSYGHQVGDDCLYKVAYVLAIAARRPPDLAARYGGEEFAVLLPNTSLEGAVEVAKKIQVQIKALQLPHQRSEVSQYVTVSFGVASKIPTETTTPEQFLVQADRALYQAKVEGRDRIAMG